MPQNPDVPLSPDELTSLREVSKGPKQDTIPIHHKKKLIALGYILEKSHSLVLTNEGRFRLAASR